MEMPWDGRVWVEKLTPGGTAFYVHIISSEARWELPSGARTTTAALPALPATTVEDEGGASVVDAIVAAIQRSPTPTRVCRPALHYQSLAVHNCRLPFDTFSDLPVCLAP